jgi:hypothetical protein
MKQLQTDNITEAIQEIQKVMDLLADMHSSDGCRFHGAQPSEIACLACLAQTSLSNALYSLDPNPSHRDVLAHLKQRFEGITKRPPQPGAKLTTRKPKNPNRSFVRGAVTKKRRSSAA